MEFLTLLGSMLLGGAVFGWCASQCRLPRVTGQLVAGLVVGALVLPAMGTDTVALLESVMHAVGCCVLFGVGGLISVRCFWSELKAISILAASALALGATMAAVVLALLPSAGAFAAQGKPAHELALFALVISTASPALLATVSDDHASLDRHARTTLGAALLLNLLVLFAVSLIGVWPLTSAATPLRPQPFEFLGDLALGVAAGITLGLAMAKFRWRATLVLGGALGLAALVWEHTHGAWLPLMAGALAAGLVRGDASAGREASNQRVLAIRYGSPALFTLLATLTEVRLVFVFLAPAAALVAARAIAFVLAGRIARKLTMNRELARLGAPSLLPQAGFAALLAVVVLPPDTAWRGMIISVVIINALIAPPLLGRALRMTKVDAGLRFVVAGK